MLLQLGAEGAHGLLHGGLIGVGGDGHVEAGLFEGLGHRLGVIHGIPQLTNGVIGIADDERGARRRRLGLRHRNGGQNCDQS